MTEAPTVMGLALGESKIVTEEMEVPSHWQVWKLQGENAGVGYRTIICLRLSLSGDSVCVYDEVGPSNVFPLGDLKLTRIYPPPKRTLKPGREVILERTQRMTHARHHDPKKNKKGRGYLSESVWSVWKPEEGAELAASPIGGVT